MKTATLFTALALWSVCAVDTAGAGTELRVGPGCTYSTIQDAVDAIPNNGSGILRIRHGGYNESVTIVNKSVRLIGGHTSCAATSPSPTGLSAIDAGGTNTPALAFMVTSGARELRVTNVNLANGTGAFAPFVPFPGGGLSVWTSPGTTANTILDKVAVFDNATEFTGGGIALVGDGDGFLTLRNNSRIFSNQVTGDDAYGGGLYCEGGYHIVMQGGSVNHNTAGSATDTAGRGGGLYLDGCSMIWFSHAQTASTADDASLRHNIVHGYGGGLYATGSAVVQLIGAVDTGTGAPASSRPLRIHDNQSRTLGTGAAGAGGAIYIQGPGTEVTVDRSWTHNNRAFSGGGAAYVSEGAMLDIVRAAETCHSPRNCSRVFGNRANSGGGAIFAFSDSRVNIRHTKVENNANGTSGTLEGRGALVAAINSTIRLEDSLIHGAFGSGHALAANGGALRVLRSTIADTEPFSTLGVFGLNGASSLFLYDSIIHEENESRPIVRVHGGTPSVDADCVVWHDDSLADLGSATRTVVADPLFADREQGLYYLQPGSPAINFCDVAPPAPGVDLDWNPRGICHSTMVSCFSDVYDLGAYELPLDIFTDRFED